MPQTPSVVVRTRCTLSVFLSLFALAFVAETRAAQLDYNGNIIVKEEEKDPGPLPLVPGDVVNFFPNPGELLGLAFRDNNLWGISRDATLLEMDPNSGFVVSARAVGGAGNTNFGLAWDSARLLFVVTDALNDVIHKVDDGGAIVQTLPAPGIGPLGAAYDPVRDGYWISDWEEERIYLVDPDTGAERRSIDVSSFTSRLAGTGYDARNDVLLFNDRISATTHLISAKTGARIADFPTPSPSLNNGQGAAIRPDDLTGYISHFEDQTIYQIDLGLEIPECFLVLGPAPGTAFFQPGDHPFETQVKRIIDWYPVTMEDYPILPLTLLARHLHQRVPGTTTSTESRPWGFTAQVMMWNPREFPENPSQWSRGVEVHVLTDGSVIFNRYGLRSGMTLLPDTVPGPSGELCVEFPFAVDGM